MPGISGISHIGLTVTDLEASAAWYKRVFGVDSVAQNDDGAHAVDVMLGEGLLIGLHTHSGTEDGDRFSEARVGLDHVAMQCADADAVEEWAEHLDELGVEHSEVLTSPFGTHLNFKDPDGNALEIFAPA